MKEKKHELKKHAATIHCSNTLSLLQRKISNALLYHAYHDLMLRDEHEITMKQLCKIIGYHGHNYDAIKNSLRGLITTLIEWNVVDDDSNIEDWTASTILASVRIKGPHCTYAYSPRMKQMLHSPKIYGKINLIIQSKFQSSYGLALYENCIRYKGLPQTKWFDLAVFRKLMGVPDDKYIIFRDLKRRVIDKSVEEINTYSDLFIEVEYLKIARQVTKLRFKLLEKEKKMRLGVPNQQILQSPLNEKLLALGIQEKHIEKILKDYKETYILEKIVMLQNYENRTDINNFPGYLLSALKNDIKIPEVKNNRHEKKINANREMSLAGEQDIIEQYKHQYDKYVQYYIEEKLQQLNSNELNEITMVFEQHIRMHHFFWEKYRKDGLNSELIKNYYRNFIRKSNPQFVSGILSFEEYLSSKQSDVKES